MEKNLSSLIGNIDIKEKSGPEDISITGLAYDSGDVKKGFAFFALKGLHTDGHLYIKDAVSRGASAVFHSEEIENYFPETVYVKVENTRQIMAPVAVAFYDNPASKMTVIGVTGTNGKSTTVSMLYQLLNLSGYKTGFLSTVQFDTGTGPVKNHYRQSTPEATEINKILHEMLKNGCTHAVIEATSHGLSRINNRMGELYFDAAVFTNISHEHLEFHKTLNRYVDDKANLFRAVKKDGTGIININDPFSPNFRKACGGSIVSYGSESAQADISAWDIRGSGNIADFTVKCRNDSFQARLNLPKIFNVDNALAALAAAAAVTEKDPGELIRHLERIRPVDGRMISVDLGQNFDVIVDYAHSPGSFEKLFPELKKMAKNRLIALFGSAGERDVEKRSRQGKIASDYSDIVILADEDPRGDDPYEILKEIASGCDSKKEGEDLFLIEDRKEAIRFAFSHAEEGDLIVLLGKGHESTIIYSGGPVPWNEKEAAESVLRELGY